MKSRTSLSGLFNIWVVAGAVVLAGALVGISGLLLYSLRGSVAPEAAATAVITLVPAPSLTPVPSITPTPAVTATPPGGAPSQSGPIQVGDFVKISGTNGEGLRLRSAPGLQNSPQFLGMDEELFEIKDGPKEADGFTWYYLVAPYDSSRSGWAASNYLTVIKQP